jgi:hypothetical protein
MMTAKQVARVREQLQDYVEEFAAEFGRSERRHWCGKYLQGLLQEGGTQIDRAPGDAGWG